MLSLLLGHHLKAREIRDAEGGRHGDVGRVATAPNEIRPMRGWLWRASNVNQRPAKKASNQALKSIG